MANVVLVVQVLVVLNLPVVLVLVVQVVLARIVQGSEKAKRAVGFSK